MSQVFDAYAAYYDLLYRDKDYAAEAAFVGDLLQQHGGITSGSLLELGCGTGKHAEYLARLGYRIHGVDMSTAMIQSARSRIPADLKEQLSFEVGDVRTVRVGYKFDAVLSLFHVASYQTGNRDISAMFATAAEHLNPGGLFIFDFWYGPAVLTDRPIVRVKRMASDLFDVLRVAEPVMQPNDNIVEVNYTVFVINRSNQRVERINETHRMRYFFSPELHFLLEHTGFNVCAEVEWMTEMVMGLDTWSGVFVAVKQ